MPALRLGWMVLPGALAGAIADERGWADGGSPTLDQLALASFIDRGELDRHLRRMRLRYRRRRDRLVTAIGDHLPDHEVGGAAAGLHVTVALTPDADIDAVLAGDRARGRGLRHPACRPPAALVGYANIAEEAIEPAIRALALAVRASLGSVFLNILVAIDDRRRRRRPAHRRPACSRRACAADHRHRNPAAPAYAELTAPAPPPGDAAHLWARPAGA